HPRVDAERLRRRRDLAHERLPPRLGREGGGALEQRRAAAGGDGELEAGQQHTDDHDRTHVRIGGPPAQPCERATARLGAGEGATARKFRRCDAFGLTVFRRLLIAAAATAALLAAASPATAAQSANVKLVGSIPY